MKKRFLAGLLASVFCGQPAAGKRAFASEDEQNSGQTTAEQTERRRPAEIPEAEPDTGCPGRSSFVREFVRRCDGLFSLCGANLAVKRLLQSTFGEANPANGKKMEKLHRICAGKRHQQYGGKQWDLRVQAPKDLQIPFLCIISLIVILPIRMREQPARVMLVIP